MSNKYKYKNDIFGNCGINYMRKLKAYNKALIEPNASRWDNNSPEKYKPIK